VRKHAFKKIEENHPKKKIGRRTMSRLACYRGEWLMTMEKKFNNISLKFKEFQLFR
jgi:hypothetical protein